MKEQDAPNPNVSNRKKRTPTHLRNISDSLGEIITASCLQPLDVIKTRLQLDTTRHYRGIIHCGATISRTEGVRALWKGFAPYAAILSLKCAFQISSDLAIQSALKDYKRGKFSNIWPLLSAFGAGLLIETFVIVTPLEVVKTRLQQQRGMNPVVLKYKGALQCAGMIIREEGFRGLWAGAAPTLVQRGIHHAAILTANNSLKVMHRKKHEGNQRKAFDPRPYLLFGLLTIATAPVVSNPFDVVKTRLMAEGGEAKYKGMMHTMRTIYAEEGLRAFWRGTLARLIWIPPGAVVVTALSYQVDRLYETSPNINVHWKRN